MNTVDALKNLYKTLTGSDYSGDPNPTDAEMIDAIAKDATSGGSGGSSGGMRTEELTLNSKTGKYSGQIDPDLTAEDLVSIRFTVDGDDSDAILSVVSVYSVQEGKYMLILYNIPSNTVLLYTVSTGALTDISD